MAAVKGKKPVHTRPDRREELHIDPDDNYFRKHFAQLVREHGGKWIVLAQGKLIGIGKKEKIPRLILKAQLNYPNSAPFIAPIPAEKELQCVL